MLKSPPWPQHSSYAKESFNNSFFYASLNGKFASKQGNNKFIFPTVSAPLWANQLQVNTCCSTPSHQSSAHEYTRAQQKERCSHVDAVKVFAIVSHASKMC